MKMHRTIGIPFAALAVALSVASPATASSQDDYLRPLLTKYSFLSSQQLLQEASRICTLIRSGASSSLVAPVVTKDLKVSASASIDITTAAIAYLNC